MRTNGMKRIVKRKRGGAAGFLLAALLAALLLSPETPRAANECVGAISTSATSRTCTATTYANGIIYLNVNPGATAVATVIVPGAATAWTVTSGAGSSGFGPNGIALDSDEPANAADAGGGLALTVGGTSATANRVTISQRSGNAGTGDRNNGIFVNQQRRGAATTTVTVGAGVTIGSSTARMNSQGIRMNVWLGTGAASITSAATIYSTQEGIDLNRGDSSDTSADTTITNTGAITAGLRGILLNYFAGDTTGGGGNQASTTTGDAKITNSGVITMHNVGTNSGAIELSYERGHGDAEVDNRGNIIANASGITVGYGIYLEYGGTNAGGAGAAKITNSGDITSKQAAIYLNNNGKGVSTITNSGALVVENTAGASRFGIYLLDRGATTTATTKVATVTNSGDITSTAFGINVNVINKNTAGDNAGIAITHSDGAIVVSGTNQQGIKANIADNDDVAANNAGDISIRVTGGSVQSSGTILEASHSQAGDVTFEVSDGVELTSTAQHGIFANLPSANTVGDVTITNAGTVTTPKTGLFVRRSALTGSGAIVVTNSGDIEKTGDVDWDGILVEDLGTGDVTIANSANIGDADDMHERGIRVEKQTGAAGGDVTVTTTGGSIFGKEYGIRVTDSGDHTGAITISNGGDITSARPINVNRNGEGALSVTNTGGTVLSDTYSAVSVRNKSGDASDVTVDVSGGTLRSPGNAIQAFNRGTGDVLHTFGADATLISESGDAVYTTLFSALAPDNQIRIAQGGAIMGRTGLYARVGGASTDETVAARADGKSDVINIAWTGSFSHGVTDEEKAIVSQSDAGRFAGSFVGVMLFSMQTLDGDDATGGVYGGAAGVEAQVMSRRAAITEVAKGDDPGAIPDNAAQRAAVPTGATASDNAYVAQFRAALGDERFDIASSVFEAIKSGATGLDDLTDADIVTYLQTDDAPTRALLRNILSLGLSDKEKTVLEALATGADEDDLEAALTAAGFTDDAADDEDYWSKVMALIDRYNPGDITVAMTDGSIDSPRGDGIRAYYATAHDNNGAIEVTVGEGAEVTGGKTGIYVSNAGATGTGEARILKQTVTVNGMVTGGTDAGVHLVGGGTLNVGATGQILAGSSGVGVLVNDPGRSVLTIDGVVKGGAGGAAAIHLTGGGSVTIGATENAEVDANGATNAILAEDGAVRLNIRVAASDTTRHFAASRVKGVIGGAGLPQANVRYVLLDAAGTPTNETPDAEFNADGTLVVPDAPEEPEAPAGPGTPGGPAAVPFDCGVLGNDRRCELYEALPSILLAMSRMPSYGERMAAPRGGEGVWARIEGSKGEWTAEKGASKKDLSHDYDVFGGRAGFDFIGRNWRMGVSAHVLKGKADMSGVGEITLSGPGVGVSATWTTEDFYVDVQGQATWLDAEVDSTRNGGMKMENDASGSSIGFGVEIGSRMALMEGLFLTPRAGLTMTRASLGDFTDSVGVMSKTRIKVEDANSAKGTAGVTVESPVAGGGVFASLDVAQDFSGDTSVEVSGVKLKTDAESTSMRLGVGGAFTLMEGVSMRASGWYETSGSGNAEYGGGLDFGMRF